MEEKEIKIRRWQIPLIPFYLIGKPITKFLNKKIKKIKIN